MTTPESLLTRGELCAKLRCGTTKLEKLRKEGLPTIQFGTRDIRFSWPEVYAWLQDRNNPASPPPEPAENTELTLH